VDLASGNGGVVAEAKRVARRDDTAARRRVPAYDDRGLERTARAVHHHRREPPLSVARRNDFAPDVAPHLVASFDTEDRTRTFFHGHSFTAHPLACAVAVANWKLLTEQPLTRPAEMARFWNEALGELRGRRGIKDVRTCGSIAAVEVDAAGGYLADVGRRMHAVCLERGVLLRPLGNVLYALPPLGTSTASLQKIADAMRAAVTE